MNMKIFNRFFLSILVTMCGSLSMEAQDVFIDVPTYNIFNHTEFSTVKPVLNTDGNRVWRITRFFFIVIDVESPTVRSLANNFTQNGTNFILPMPVLEWQLKTIGNSTSISGGNIPGFQSFSTNFKDWYTLSKNLIDLNVGNNYSNGDVAFTFRIPATKFTENTFHAGNYSAGITHNYIPRGISFTPSSFNLILKIPAAISWLTNVPIANYQISTLDQYRSQSGVLDNLFLAELGNTMDFNLMGKIAGSNIQFTSSKGTTGTRPISSIKLGSTNPKVITSGLSSSWVNYSPTNNFKVEVGNRNKFQLQLSISGTDLKTHFFEAGTYKFQLNLDAKSTDNRISAIQNTDITLMVPPLSEITIPTSGNEVNFEFNTVADYQNGKSKIVPNQIKLSNNETYELYVKSDSKFFRRSGVQSDVPSSILQVGVEGGTQSVTLSATSKKIVSNGTPVLDKDLNIKYTIPAASAQTLVSKTKSTYSIAVIYSFTAL